MTQVAKLIVIDNDNNYLLLERSNHPYFGNDPDLPGGTVEEGEQPLQAMVREVKEEASLIIDGSTVRRLYEGSEHSTNGTHYYLYMTELADRPIVQLSWEHTSYKWLTRAKFLEKAKNAVDTYMQMVYEVCIMTDKTEE